LKGWKVFKNGWPDYLICKGKEICFVEVKDKQDRLKEDQHEMLGILTQYGLKCYVWKPKTGFKRYKEDEKHRVRRRAELSGNVPAPARITRNCGDQKQRGRSN